MAPKKRGLGRGLNALFEDEETEFVPVQDAAEELDVGQKRQIIGIEQLGPSPLQPRKLFEQDSLEELAESIKAHGLLQPIIARPAGEEGDSPYEIIAGERRWRAAQLAQLHELPVIILELSDTEALEIALIENLQREDLNPVDEAMGYQKLLEEYKYTQEKLAESLGKSRPHIANMIRLLSLPDIVLAHLERGDLSTGHARALITAKDPVALSKEVISKNLNVRQTEALVAEADDRPRKTKPVKKQGKDVDTIALENEISNALGMRVSINSRDGNKGKVTIEFKSLDQLDEVLKKLSG